MIRMSGRCIAALVAAAAFCAGAPSPTQAAAGSACVAKADREGLAGGVRRAYLRECRAGRRLDLRAHKTFRTPGAPASHANARCLGVERNGRCAK